jgi:CubicO group peptidase (beta-lactamase class C family)
MSITKIFRRKALAIGAAAALLVPLSGCLTPLDGTAAPDLESYASKLTRTADFSGVILLAREGEIEFQGAYGLADRQSGRSNTVDTKFSLASVPKMFTAVSILQLVDIGAISLDDTIGTHLPDYPNRAAAERVTIEHLLMHTSGVGNYWAAMEKLDDDSLDALDSHSDYLPLFADIPLEHEPGTAFSYSNGGYVVLGLIIEAVTGTNYYDHVQAAVFDRAGMQDTGYFFPGKPVPDRAKSYMRSVERPGMWDDMAARAEPRGSAAGGGYSTAGDLLRFATALTQHRLLSPGMTDVFLQGRRETPVGNYGYGIIEQSLNGTRLLGHSGGHYGVAAELMIFPDLDTVFVVLSNGDVDAYWDVEMYAHEMIVGPTDETRNYAFTKQLIAETVARGYDAGLKMHRDREAARKVRGGVIDLAAFKYIHRKHYEEGIDLLRLNRAIAPDSDDAIFSLAQGLRIAGRNEEALETYRAYLERVPDSSEAKSFIAAIMRDGA